MDALCKMVVNLDHSDAALPPWSRALEFLEGQEVGYRAKVLSSRLLYPRRDALVVYLREQAGNVTSPATAVAGAEAAAGA